MPLSRLESPVWVLLARHLSEESLTVFDLSSLVGITPRNIRHYLREAHEKRLIRIVSWTRRSATLSGRPVPVYRFGRGPDTAKPPGSTGAERQRRLRARPLLSLEKKWVKQALNVR